MIHVVSGCNFCKVYERCKDKDYIDTVIKAGDRVALDSWMKANQNLDDLSIRELRVIASNKQIPCYSRMDKSTLVKALNVKHP